MKKRLSLTRWLANISITTKLYSVIAIFLLTTIGIIFLAKSGMDNLSAIRAYVAGEGLWAKAQKDAVYSLKKYASTNDEEDFQKFREFLKVPLGDKKSRLELQKQNPDSSVIYQGFIEGGNPPEDAKGLGALFRRFRKFGYMKKALNIWAEADLYIGKLERLGSRLHHLVASSQLYPAESYKQEKDEIINRIDAVNSKLLGLENNFSYTLGEASRWGKRIFTDLMLVGALIIGGVGLLIIMALVRDFLLRINALAEVTTRVGEGSFDERVEVGSKDELGKLTNSFNKMVKDLQRTTVSRDYVDNIIKSMVETLIVVGPDARIKTVNRATADLLGYEEAELIGKPVAVIFTQEDDVPFTGKNMKALLKQGFLKDYEMTYRAKDGDLIPVNFSGSIMRNSRGELVGVIGVARDVRELKKLQLQLIQAEKLVGVGQLAAGVAHELNTPLAGLLGLLRVYKKGVSQDSQADKDLNLMVDAAEHMAHVVRDLTAFARQSKSEFEELDLNDVIESTLSFSSRQLIVKNIKMTKKYTSNLLKILGDKSQLQQVVLNMITNARDAIIDGGEFTIKTRNSKQGGKVVMEFIDTGIGIKKENISRIFDPFFTTKKPGKGAGLGLSVAHGIIKAHGAEIMLETHLERGTKFKIMKKRKKSKEKESE